MNREEIKTEIVDRERRIYEEQARTAGKPEAMIGKIVEGQVEQVLRGEHAARSAVGARRSKTIRQLVDGVEQGDGDRR